MWFMPFLLRATPQQDLDERSLRSEANLTVTGHSRDTPDQTPDATKTPQRLASDPPSGQSARVGRGRHYGGVARRARSVSVGVIAIGTLLLVSCGSDEPSAFAEREKLPDCGSLPDRGFDAPMSTEETEALNCLQSAAASGDSAEMSYAFLTTEGDPMRYWLRVKGGSVEMFEHSDDSFGSKGWTYFASCDLAVSELVALPLPERCGKGLKL